MALSPKRNINGSGLLECLFLIPCEIAYTFFEDSPPVVFKEIAEHFKGAGDFVEKTLPFVEVDIKRASSAEVLFREDSLTSKILRGIALCSHDEFMFHVISPVVFQVLDEDLQYTTNGNDGLSPLSLSIELVVKVKSMINGLLKRLLIAMDKTPILYRVLLRNVTKMTAKVFQGENVQRSIVSSFFFLRYLCPCIISPSKYGVPSPQRKKDGCRDDFPKEIPLPLLRTLILISKVLQAIGNGTGIDSSKEGAMLVFSSFVEEKQLIIQDIFEKLIEPVKIAKYFSSTLIQQKEAKSNPKSCKNISPTLSNYIRNRISAEGSLGGYIYDSMRILPEISKSHPVTWSKNEVSIWLRSVGLEKYIPAFFKENMIGIRLLELDGQSIVKKLGIPSITAQKEIINALKRLMVDYKDYEPLEVVKHTVRNWKTSDIVLWLDSFEYEVDCSILATTMLMTGPEFLHVPPDFLFCLGFNVEEVRILRDEMRKLEVSLHSKKMLSLLPYNQKVMSGPVPGEIWLRDLHLEASVIPPKASEVPSPPRYYSGFLLCKRKRLLKMYWCVLDIEGDCLYQFPEDSAPSLTDEQVDLAKTASFSFPLDKFYALPCNNYEQNSFYLQSVKEKIQLKPLGNSQLAEEWVSYISHSAKTLVIPKLSISIFAVALLSVSGDSQKVLAINYAAKELLCAPFINYYDNQPIKRIFNKSGLVLGLLSKKGRKKVNVNIYPNRVKTVGARAKRYVEYGEQKILIALWHKAGRNPAISKESIGTLRLEVKKRPERRASGTEETMCKPIGFLDFISELEADS